MAPELIPAAAQPPSVEPQVGLAEQQSKSTEAQLPVGKRVFPSTMQNVAPLVPMPPPKKMRVSELLGIPSANPTESFRPDPASMLTVSGEWAAADAVARAIPRDQGLPLTILTGFLGAGKSTVLNYILHADHGMKVAVLINEFGEVDIDNQLVDTVTKGEEGEPVVLNNGCICCTVSNGFIDAVQSVLARADANDDIPDYFIVETTGLADPKPIVDSVCNTELRDELYVDQVLTVVDGSAFSEKHYESPTARKQIEAADTVLLSKTDLVTEDAVKEVVSAVRAIRPNARILKSQKGHVPIAALFDLGLSLMNRPATKSARKKGNPADDAGPDKEKAEVPKEPSVKSSHDHHSGHDHKHEHHKNHIAEHSSEHKHHSHAGEACDKDHDHDHDHHKKPNHLEEEGFSSVSFVTEHPFSLRRFKTEFMDKLPAGVFRSKGILMFVNFSTRFVFHWSGSRYNVEEDTWPQDAERKNQLVVIGRDLNKSKIAEMLRGCIVLPGEESEDEDEEYVDEENDEIPGVIGDNAGPYGERLA